MKSASHIKPAHKKVLLASDVQSEVFIATYPEDKDLYEKLGISTALKQIGFVFKNINQLKQKQKKSIMYTEIEKLGFKVLPKSEISSLKFKLPVPQKKHKEVVQSIKEMLDLTQEELAEIIGCSPKKIWSILKKDEPFKRKSDVNNFNQLVGLINQLLGIVQEKNLKDWIKTTQKSLGNKKPIDIFISGDIEPIRIWIYKQLDGVYQ